jgi:hypothetical protein
MIGPGRLVLVAALWLAADAAVAASLLEAQNQMLFQAMREAHQLSDEQMAAVRSIFAQSGILGQGNPAITEHPATTAACRAELERRPVDDGDARAEVICGGKHMAPLYDPATETADEAADCIDRFEFPNIPCAYPVVWVRAREAAELCRAVGKRLCDAHEWEGACAGRLAPPDYRFDLAYGSPNGAVERMRQAHNQAHAADKTWSYGPAYQEGVCAAASRKSTSCDGGGWSKCGSNTYPAGMFPGCRSPLGVYDLNGNAAEHMNLPLAEAEMASRGSEQLGHTEMKGSWFIFDRYRAHEDWCRWRAPYWHGSRVMDANSHANYHLGFRCCKTLSNR